MKYASSVEISKVFQSSINPHVALSIRSILCWILIGLWLYNCFLFLQNWNQEVYSFIWGASKGLDHLLSLSFYNQKWQIVKKKFWDHYYKCKIKSFLDRHPMAISWFHPGRFVTFCESIKRPLLFFFLFLFFFKFKRSARFKRNFRHNCMPVLGLA